jgi:hypothetical protein
VSPLARPSHRRLPPRITSFAFRKRYPRPAGMVKPPPSPVSVGRAAGYPGGRSARESIVSAAHEPATAGGNVAAPYVRNRPRTAE